MRYDIRRFESLESTNLTALGLASAGEPEGTVVTAVRQTAGRGRLGRKWISPGGLGLYLSVILRPDVPLDSLWQVAFLCAAASARALNTACSLDVRIKWPNDLLVNDSKVGGIYVEARIRDGVAAVVAGIGINISNRSFPTDISGTATSLLLETGIEFPVEVIEKAFLDSLDEEYAEYLTNGFAGVMDEWRSLDTTVGRTVTVHAPAGTLRGRAEVVQADGGLRIHCLNGETAVVGAGDVLFDP